MPIDFSSLPKPAIIAEIDFEAILEALIEDAIERFTAAGVDYDVDNLETDPVKIQLEVDAFREGLLRAAINAAAKANLLPFANGSDLDHLAGFYDVERLSLELDPALRQRVVLAISGRSTAGPEEWYEFHAKSADVRIREVKVHKVDGGPKVRVAVLSSVNGGVPDAPMLSAVTEAVNNPAVRSVNDVIEVAAATQQTVNIIAKIWLLPEAPITVFEGLDAVLTAAWAAESGIGFDLNPSWIAARLHVAGVSKVEVTAPAAPVTVADTHAIALGTRTITLEGRLR
jgi:phage-related baseplate assembly protein